MGNVMASSSTSTVSTVKPDGSKESAFDPLFGFPEGRKERVMIATQEEMDSAKIALHDRDYCTHLLINYRACRADQWPFAYRCGHEKHEYLTCQNDDYLIRMKDFERERRLLQRKRRIEERQAKESS